MQVLGEVPPELRVTPERDRRLREQAAALAATDAVRLLDLVVERARGDHERRAAADPARARADQGGRARGRPLDRRRCSRGSSGSRPGWRRGPGCAGSTSRSPNRTASRPRPPSNPRRTARRRTPEPQPATAHTASTAQTPRTPRPPRPRRPTTPPRPRQNRHLGPVRDSNRHARPPLGPRVLAGGGRDREGRATRCSPRCSRTPAPSSITERELTLAFPPGAAFLKRKAEQDDHRRVAADAFRTVTGQSLALRLRAPRGRRARRTSGPGNRALSGEELVRRFLEEFDAEEILDDDADTTNARPNSVAPLGVA